jgi:hypothetical protein
MESAVVNDPKDEHILNKDDSITNKDGDNYLEKGEQPATENKPDPKQVPTVTPDNDNGEPGQPAGKKTSEKDAETRKRVL